MKEVLAPAVLGAVLALAITLLAEEAGAFSLPGLGGERFAFGRWEGSGELGYDWEDQTVEVVGTPEREFLRSRYDERLQIRNQGYYIADPRLLTGSSGIDFDFYQEQDRFSGLSGSQNGVLIGYDTSVSILADTAYPATLFGNRQQSVVTRDFGGRSEIISGNLGATLRLREDSLLRDHGFPFFTSTLDLRQERTKQSTSMLGQTFELDEVRRILSYEGNKGFETADLGFRYEFTDVRDSGTSHLTFQTQDTSLTYSLDFGPTLNRRWDSRIHYFARSGAVRSSFFWADEQLEINHYDALATSYRYLLSRIETDAGTMTNHNGTFQLQHRLYENLQSTLSAQGMFQTLPGGQRFNYAGQLGSSYHRRLPWNGTFSLNTGGRYQIDHNNLAASRISVTDEPHVAPSTIGAGSSFTLDNPFVIVSTIVMVDTRGGARIPTTLGIDYEILQEGELTMILLLPTSVIIQPDDPLAVSYLFEVAPIARFSTAANWVSAGLRFRWIEFSFEHSDYRQTPLSGRDGRFLLSRRSDRAEMELQRDWESLQARASAGYFILDSTDVRLTRPYFRQFLSYRTRFDLRLGLDAEESFTHYTMPKRETQTRSMRFSLDRFAGRWFTSAFFRLRTYDDSLIPSETVYEAGVKARFRYGKLEFTPTLTWINREWGSTLSKDLRLEIRINRRL